jgi:PAS domain S-box-containing protein
LETRVRERTAELSSANLQLRREIGDRRRAEHALRASEERYRLVSELTSDYAYSFAVELGGICRVEWLTDAFARISGHSPSELEAGAWDRIVHPDDLPVVERRMRSLLDGRSAVSEFRIMAGDGQIRWLRDHARPVWSESKRRVVRILGAAQDITDRKQAEEEARRHQAALAQMARLTTVGEMAAQLAHELNQPLCTMVGNAQTAQRLLAAPIPDLAEVRDALNDIVTFGNQAATVIRRLREFLRQQQPQPVVLNVQRMIEEVAGFLEVDARQHATRVVFDVADDLPVIRGDPIQLQQVLLNLVRNGLEAMDLCPGSPREIVVRASRGESGSALIDVTDNGAGLDAETAGRIFEPFFTTKPAGLGLGLAICRSIVEAHGGQLRAKVTPGRGTTLSILLPAVGEEVTL